MDPGIPVPPKDYGGHERLVYMFAEEYIKLGHDVTVLAGPDSYCSGKTVTFGKNGLPKSRFQSIKEIFWVWKYLIFNASNFDLIHNFGRLVYYVPILNHKVNKIMTYGRPVAKGNIKRIMSLPNKNIVFTGCSKYLVSTGNVAGNWKTVYNAIDFSRYTLNPIYDNEAPLIFFSRLDKIKGCHNAISIAKQANHKLIIAGNVSNLAHERAYFENEIEPHIDGERVVFVGALNDEQKNHYLGQAKALLFPIEWDEPFGMAMVEAMACGTPVIAFKRGSVPEIIKDGVNGFVVANINEAMSKVADMKNIDRNVCRNYAVSLFDVSVVARNYLNI